MLKFNKGSTLNLTNGIKNQYKETLKILIIFQIISQIYFISKNKNVLVAT